MSQLSKRNSNYRALSNSEYWFGLPEKVGSYQGVTVNCKSDTDCTLECQWSNDGTNWDFVETSTVTANNPFVKTYANKASYYRLKIENTSGSNQSYLSSASRFVADVPDHVTLNMDAQDKERVITAIPYFFSKPFNNDSVVASTDTPQWDVSKFNNFTFCGWTNGTTFLKLLVSDNATDWFENETIYINTGGQFYVHTQNASRYLKVRVMQACDITLAVMGKM